ncbi:MAG: Spi family protease inhibitor [Dysgonomonas sp.]|nr:Spi family protease inhibitor [Dysgonomonas sp.]
MKQITIYTLLLIFLFSCSTNTMQITEITTEANTTNKGSTTLIEWNKTLLSDKDAALVAQSFIANISKKTKNALPEDKTIADVSAIDDAAGNPVAYVVNFEEGGFCIISATKENYPIQAYSDEGSFDPNALITWESPSGWTR